MVCWSMTQEAVSFTVMHWFFPHQWHLLLQWPVCAWPGRGEPVTGLTHFWNFILHSYTCCSDRYASPHCTFILRRISMGLVTTIQKKTTPKLITDCCSLVHVTSGAPIFKLLPHLCVILQLCAATCRPIFRSCLSPLPTSRRIAVSKFYHAFEVFIWLSLVFQ